MVKHAILTISQFLKVYLIPSPLALPDRTDAYNDNQSCGPLATTITTHYSPHSPDVGPAAFDFLLFWFLWLRPRSVNARAALFCALVTESIGVSIHGRQVSKIQKIVVRGKSCARPISPESAKPQRKEPRGITRGGPFP